MLRKLERLKKLETGIQTMSDVLKVIVHWEKSQAELKAQV